MIVNVNGGDRGVTHGDDDLVETANDIARRIKSTDRRLTMTVDDQAA